MRKSLAASALLLVTLIGSIGGCQKSATVPGMASRTATSGARAAAADGGDAAVLGDMALVAHAALANADKVYKELGLDKSAGRRLDPKREGQTVAGLRPVIQRFESDGVAIATRLTAQFNPAMTAVLDDFEKRRPATKDTFGPNATASDMVYRIAQYRVKFGFLVEVALRSGALPNLPGRDPAPKPAEPPVGDSPADE